MGRYSDMIREAQRTAPGNPFGRQDAPGGGPGTGVTEYEYGPAQRTGGLDPASKAAQESLIGELQGERRGFTADLGEKYDFAESQFIGGLRSGLGSRNIGRKSGVAQAAEAIGRAPFRAGRVAEETALGISGKGMLGNQLIGTIGQGRETYQYPRTRVTQGPSYGGGGGGGGGGGSFINYAPSNYESIGQGTYERNRDKAQARYGTASQEVTDRYYPRTA